MATTDKDKKTYSWGTPNFFEELATFNEQKKQEQAKKVAALKKKVSEESDRELAKTTRNYTTTSNATTSVARGRLQNKHLEERGLRGAALHAAWEREHPNLSAWSLTAAAIPFAVAAYPFAAGATAAADATAATATGLAITSGLNFAANAIKANPYVAKALPWINAGLTSLFAGHGASEVSQGRFTPMTALELAPLGQLAKPIFSSAINFGKSFIVPRMATESTVSDLPNIVRTVLDNGKIRLSLPSHTDAKPRLLVIEPLGGNKYYVHTRTWNGDHIPANMSTSEKQALYDALYEELPEGAEILFPLSSSEYLATRGTVAGLLRLARDSRFTPGTRGTLLYLDKDGKTVRTYEGTSFIKAPRITPENAASDIKYFKDDYGNEVIPTPYPGSDEALLSNIKKATEAVADHYFTDPQKIQLVKQTMGWGDAEYNELLEELSRILRYGEGEVKGVSDGFKSIAEAGIRGFLGEDASMVYPNNIVTLNRDRLPNDNRALEAAIHELGGHAKTLHIDPNRNGGIWDELKLMYPRVTLLMEKNKEIADATLLLNEKGRFYALFPNSSDLEIFLEEHPEYKSMTEKLFNMRRRFKYITGDTLERAARGYTQQLMDHLGKPSDLGLTEFYTQPSVNEFSKRVLNIAAPITFTLPFLNNDK